MKRCRPKQDCRCFGKDAADFSGGAVFVVGGRFHNHGHATWPITFVNNLLKMRGLVVFAGAALDRALDVVVRHALSTRRLDRAAQPRIGVWIATATFCSDRDFLRQLAKNLPAFGVNRALEPLYLRPFAMSRHRYGV
jgi:hypothetical protein